MWLPESETPEIDITGIEPERAGPQRYGVFISEQVQTFNKSLQTLQAVVQQKGSFSYRSRLKGCFSSFSLTVFITPPSVGWWRPSLANGLTKSARLRLQSVSAGRAGVNFFTSRN